MWSYGPHWGMMGGWGYGSYGAFDMLLWPIILIAVIVGVVWFMRKDGSQGIQFMPGAARRGSMCSRSVMLAAKSAETNTWKRSATSKGEPSAPWLTKWPCAAAPRLCSPANISPT